MGKVETVVTERVAPDGGKEYSVKWQGKGHMHNTWEPERRLLRIAPRKLTTFLSRQEQGRDGTQRQEWVQVDRVLDQRKSKRAGCQYDYLVKWESLSYDQ